LCLDDPRTSQKAVWAKFAYRALSLDPNGPASRNEHSPGAVSAPRKFGGTDTCGGDVPAKANRSPQSPPGARRCRLSAVVPALRSRGEEAIPKPSLVLIWACSPRRAWRGSATRHRLYFLGYVTFSSKYCARRVSCSLLSVPTSSPIKCSLRKPLSTLVQRQRTDSSARRQARPSYQVRVNGNASSAREPTFSATRGFPLPQGNDGVEGPGVRPGPESANVQMDLVSLLHGVLRVGVSFFVGVVGRRFREGDGEDGVD
jgi:hypothetical protein